MKYLPLRDFENVTSALNFDTSDCHVTGGCDMYTTKAAGSDKKLYKDIETSLESQHESLVRLSASLSPPSAELFSLNLDRPSPFGSLSQVSSRRTFAYLIATLNASHPDYDFSHILRPSDFRKERSLRTVMTTLDDTLHNLRPRPSGTTLAGSNGWASSTTPSAPQTPGGSQTWGPKMWRLIDKEMSLRECEIYCYSPDEDPFDGEENALWSSNYLFFNKDRKRVCYLYIRTSSISSHSPRGRNPAAQTSNRVWPISRSLGISYGASKRAHSWLGGKTAKFLVSGLDEDEDDFAMPDLGDDEVDADYGSEFSTGWSSDYEEEEIERMWREKSAVRGMSEHMAETMEV